jgi:hypothetical protein
MSPHLAEDFATDVALASLPVGHDTGRCRNDRHTDASADASDVLGTLVDTVTRLGDPLYALKNTFAV